MKTIIISPYSRTLDGRRNPKTYPLWEDLVSLIINEKDLQIKIIQVGLSHELMISGVHEMIKNASIDDLSQLIKDCDTWISIDNFFHHLATFIGKKGVVIFGPSDPLIFGHPQNINLLKDRQFLRPDQFNIWEQCETKDDIFPSPIIVFQSVKSLLSEPIVENINKSFEK